MPDATQQLPTDGPIPADAGLPQGGALQAGPSASRTGDELIAAGERAGSQNDELSGQEQTDLLDYFLTNKGLPGDDAPIDVEWTIGEGDAKRSNVWKIKPIGWDEFTDARERATDPKTGVFDSYTQASWIVARALVEPKLAPTVGKMQKDDPDKAPQDASALLRRMFRRQSGVLLEINIKVLEISKLTNENNSVRTLGREVEAGKD